MNDPQFHFPASTRGAAAPRGLAALFFIFMPVLPATHVRAQEQEASSDAGTLPMQEISPGVFQIGKMRVDKNAMSVSFAAKVNQVKDNIEYVMVTPDGSTHESLLVAAVQPVDLQFAMLLLGAKGAGLTTPAADEAPPAQIDAEYLRTAPKLKGDNVILTAKWKDKEGTERSAQIEEWIKNTDAKKAPEKGPWIHTGSMFGADGKFLAQQQGVFISVVTNPSALINNPRPGNDNDLVWEVNEKTVPPVDTPIEFTIALQPGITEAK